MLVAGLGYACKARTPISKVREASTAADAQAAGVPNLTQAGNRFGPKYGDRFLDEVQPVLAKRCVVCHACAESPCQLKLDSYEGIERGLSKVDPYAPDLKVFNEREPTAHADQYDVATWRQKGFYGVVNHSQNADKQAQAGENADSIFFKAISAGNSNAPGFNGGGAAALLGKQQCPVNPADYQKLQLNASYSDGQGGAFLAGMPLGLPKLDEAEFKTLVDWIKDGAPGPSEEARAKLNAPTSTSLTQGGGEDVTARWEDFFKNGANGATPGVAVDLVSRYIYEHTFLAHYHFDENPGEFYMLVRSRTAPGQPLDEIFTRRPFDEPGVSPVYYRLKKFTSVIARKNHVVWRVNDKRLDWFKNLFYPTDNKWWSGNLTPGTYAKEGINAFRIFKQIPSRIRYQWLLDNTSLLVDFMTRGPVCVGSQATYVVADHFWGWFLDPDSDPTVQDPNFEIPDHDYLSVKAPRTVAYLKKFEVSLRALLKQRGKVGLSVDDIWDGKKGNPPGYLSPTAWLTIVRHETNMTVHEGLRGGWPQSVWVLSFAHLERLFYDLVVNFDAYGSTDHKLETWEYMSYIRTEGEDNFISFMPDDRPTTGVSWFPGIHGYKSQGKTMREQIREQYTSGWMGTLRQWYNGEGKMLSRGRPSGSTGPISPQILANQVRQKLADVLAQADGDPLNNWPQPNPGWNVPQITDRQSWETGLRTLTKTYKWSNAKFFPNVMYLRVGSDGDDPMLYTIITNRGYLSHNNPLTEGLARNHDIDDLSAFAGIEGNYPNVFIDLPFAKASAALVELQAVTTREAFDAFKAKYMVQQNSEQFWPFVDWVNAWQAKNDPINAGIIDLKLYNYDGK